LFTAFTDADKGNGCRPIAEKGYKKSTNVAAGAIQGLIQVLLIAHAQPYHIDLVDVESFVETHILNVILTCLNSPVTGKITIFCLGGIIIEHIIVLKLNVDLVVAPFKWVGAFLINDSHAHLGISGSIITGNELVFGNIKANQEVDGFTWV
jgi:hypothetical protein